MLWYHWVMGEWQQRYGALNSRCRRTLRRIRETPTQSDIRWQDVVALLEALGATVTGRKGSVFRVSGIGNKRMILHRPHPGDQCAKGLIDKVRIYLEDIS